MTQTQKEFSNKLHIAEQETLNNLSRMIGELQMMETALSCQDKSWVASLLRDASVSMVNLTRAIEKQDTLTEIANIIL